MATGKCKIGDTVFATAKNVLNSDVVMAAFPICWQVVEIRGTVLRHGSGRKWVVGWDLGLFSVKKEHEEREVELPSLQGADRNSILQNLRYQRAQSIGNRPQEK